MQTISNLPNGQVMTLTALAIAEVQGYLQDITLQLLGVSLPAVGATDAQIDAVYRQVRVDFPEEGQPTWSINEDVCFITAHPDTQENLLTRNTATTAAGSAATITQQYGRGWSMQWTFYGPNSSSRSTLIHSALLGSFALNAFQSANLYITAGFSLPNRAPEKFNAQWWDRYDLRVRFTEPVVITVSTGTVAVVPLTVTAQEAVYNGYGSQPYGSGGYGDTYVDAAETIDNTTVTAS